jgi:hypothetical protein
LNKEIEKGDTYPMIDPIPLESFGPYWFVNFGAVMLLGDINSVQEVRSMERVGADWRKICLGSFHIKPNYPGRSSHVCNGTFLVTDAARNRGVGRLMGEGYLEWAPQLVSFSSHCGPCSRIHGKIVALTDKYLHFNRATRILFSIWYMRTTLLLAVSGMH